MHGEEFTGVIGIGVHVTNLQQEGSRNERQKKKARHVLEKVKGRTAGGCLLGGRGNFFSLRIQVYSCS